MRAIRQTQPRVGVLIVSGYAEMDDGIAPDLLRLAKPFRKADLAASLTAASVSRGAQ